MGRKRVPGLIMRAGIWHIDKRIFGRRVCQSTGTAQLEEAERYLARVMEEDPPSSDLRRAGPSDLRAGRGQVRAREPAQAEPSATMWPLKGLMPCIGNIPSIASHGVAAAVDRRKREPGLHGRHHQPWAADRAAHPQSGGVRVGGRAGADVAAGRHRRSSCSPIPTTAPALSAELGGAGAAVRRAARLILTEMALFAVNTGCRRCRNLRPALGMGGRRCPSSAPPSSSFPGRRVKNGDGPAGGAQPDRTVRDRGAAWAASDVRVLPTTVKPLGRMSTLGMEDGARAGGAAPRAGA